MTSYEPIPDSVLIESPEQAMVLLNPLRAEIAARLAEPGSAAEVARAIGEAPQRINYHLKALEKAGLVRRIGSRQVRNLVEVLYQSIARTFVLSERLGMKPETVRKLKDQGSLAHLIGTADRIKQDALLLMEQSDEGEEIPSATLQFQVELATPERRQAFVEEYARLVQELTGKYGGSGESGAYQVVVAVYPEAPGRAPAGEEPSKSPSLPSPKQRRKKAHGTQP
ncbi:MULTISPECIES: ArsR/SmtB family transcription factor [Paenibacillus]|uniref:ArsR/SmtB family transcription factor n=1 Tax=Paenibacillus TaxID=44249 RepID=UPI0022B8AA90|nr:helix-turn-helix domain-containing protein [Paenibacillus caseinilyticus]MCZ8520772.1 helix-turn-helix domain-containing protein [Paenibacillus caseinilyticus]